MPQNYGWHSLPELWVQATSWVLKSLQALSLSAASSPETPPNPTSARLSTSLTPVRSPFYFSPLSYLAVGSNDILPSKFVIIVAGDTQSKLTFVVHDKALWLGKVGLHACTAFCCLGVTPHPGFMPVSCLMARCNAEC